MQEVIKKNDRLENKFKHVGGPLHEKIPNIEDLNLNDEGIPEKPKKHY